jgi:hypothetical protein
MNRNHFQNIKKENAYTASSKLLVMETQKRPEECVSETAYSYTHVPTFLRNLMPPTSGYYEEPTRVTILPRRQPLSQSPKRRLTKLFKPTLLPAKY